MTYRKRFAASVIAAAVLATAPAQAQSGGDGDESRIQGMIQEIRELIQRAEEKRQADPWLIEDVRDVLAKYDFPWQRTVYAENFDTQARGAPRPWQVMTGEFRVGARGLQSLVPTTEQLEAAQEAEQGDRANERKPQSSDGNQQMRELLGSVLDQALGDGGDKKPDQPSRADQERSTPPEAVPARAILPVSMGNAFAVRIKFTAKAPDAGGGGLAIGPYQGDRAQAGYRLNYRPAAGQGAGAFEVTKHGLQGTQSTVARADGTSQVADGEQHTLLWTRDRDGRMQIDIDGKRIVDVTDRGFGDPFAGLVLHNSGGDYAVSSLVIKDAQ